MEKSEVEKGMSIISVDDEESRPHLVIKGSGGSVEQQQEADEAGVGSGLTVDLYLFTSIAPVMSRCVGLATAAHRIRGTNARPSVPAWPVVKRILTGSPSNPNDWFLS